MSEPNKPAAAPAAAAPVPVETGNPKRRRALTAVAAAVVVAGAAYGAYWALVLNHYESTDNAYVQGNLVQLTPQVSGTVIAINADDTDHVKAGQTLVKLDPAEAQLGQTVREVRTTFANNSTLKAQIALREADVAKTQSDLIRAQEDVTRREPLLQTGAVGREEYNHAQAQVAATKSSLAAAQSAVVAAREQLASNQTLTEGVSVDQHPNVLRAAARVREAYLALHRAELVTPVDGYIAKRSVQLGQRVPAGAPLMSVIALNGVWVEANFKESQLKNIRIGQPVTLEADMYGKKVEYHGKIEGLGAGTGAAFALLPAQNATGNWIKVVQRLPVRIQLDPKELVDHPLRVGLSMDATVDVSNTGGAVLAGAGSREPVAETAVYAMNNTQADNEVRKIIAANSGRPARDEAVATTKSGAAAKAPSPAMATAAGSLSAVAEGGLPRTTALK